MRIKNAATANRCAGSEGGRELCRQAILRHVPANAVRRYQNRLRPVRDELRDEIARRLAEAAE